MKRFKFRLQTVLDQRQTVEDRLLAELAELRREEQAEIHRLRALESVLASAERLLESALQENRNADEISRRDDYAKTMRDDVRLQELTLEAVQRRVEAKRVELIDAMRDRKVMEALRDRQQREYLMAQARAEQNSLDEIASLRFARGM